MSQELTTLAIEELNIDVPVMRVKIKGNVLWLWLYGRDEPSEWQIPDYLTSEGEAVIVQPDDLTQIDTIGPATAARLRSFGISTFRQLADASIEDIRGVVRAGEKIIETWQAGARHFLGE